MFQICKIILNGMGNLIVYPKEERRYGLRFSREVDKILVGGRNG